MIFVSSAQGTLITFEDLPDAYFFSSGGQDIASFYSGLTFSANVTALSASRFGGYSDAAYPPHTRDVVIWDPFDSSISLTFTTPIDAFGIWYTSLDPLELDAFDGSNNLLGTVIGLANTDGTTGTSSFIVFAGTGIQSIDLTGSAGQYVLDDLATGADVGVPEPSTWPCVFGFFLLWYSAAFVAQSPGGTRPKRLVRPPSRVTGSRPGE
jgi:hypothetical protein